MLLKSKMNDSLLWKVKVSDFFNVIEDYNTFTGKCAGWVPENVSIYKVLLQNQNWNWREKKRYGKIKIEHERERVK